MFLREIWKLDEISYKLDQMLGGINLVDASTLLAKISSNELEEYNLP